MLTNKVAIITGAGSGLGEEAAKLFAKNGAAVVVADYDFEAAVKVHIEIQQAGGESIPYRVNVADREAMEKMVADVLNTFGQIDILVNNAGITKDASILKMTDEQWNAVIDVNLKGVYNGVKAVVPHMIERGVGNIINTASIVGTSGNAYQANYGSSKGGVIALSKGLAKELGGKGIRVNAVAPGFIMTPMVAKMPEKVLNKMIEKVPMGRLGNPIEIAQAYLFLASDMSTFVNGTVLEVDGGMLF